MAIPRDLIHRAACIAASANAQVAAHELEERAIGSLVVLGEDGPIGIVTDRDIALHVLENELDPTDVPVGDCMSEVLVSIREDEDISDAIDAMRTHGIRRLPILERDGGVGIVTADDLVLLLARELNRVAAAIRRGIGREGAVATGATSPLGQE